MKTEIDSDLPRRNDYSAREVRKHLLSSDWGREMRSWREQLKSIRREGLLPPISLALPIAVGVIIASYVIYDQSTDRKAITINLLTEAVGIVVGGIVVALIFQLILESRSEKRWSTARVAILQQLESHYRAIIYVARDQWRWGYRLPPLPDNAQLEESLKVFRDQLENARLEKYKWYDNHGSHIYPISDAIDDFWRACNVIREISEKSDYREKRTEFEQAGIDIG